MKCILYVRQKLAYCRLIISCLHELSSVPSLLLSDTPIKRFLGRYEKYYAPRVIRMTTRFIPSLSMLASSAFLDYGDFSVTGFGQKFLIDLRKHLSDSQLNAIPCLHSKLLVLLRRKTRMERDRERERKSIGKVLLLLQRC